MADETSLTPQEHIDRFKKTIEDWVNGTGIVHTQKLDELKTEEIQRILDSYSFELKGWTGDECLQKAFELHSYSEYVQSLYNKEKMILQWAEDSILAIIGPNLSNYGDNFVKYEQKYYAAIKESPLAKEILKTRVHARAKTILLTGLVESLRSMGDVLKELGRKRC